MVMKEAPDHFQTTDPSERIVYYKTRGSLLVAVNRALKKMDDDPNYTVKENNSPVHDMNRAQLEKVVARYSFPTPQHPLQPQLQEGSERLKKTPPPGPKQRRKHFPMIL